MASLLEEQDLTPEQRHYATTIAQCGESLLKVINDRPQNIHYVMLTDASGTIDVYKREPSIRHLQHMQGRKCFIRRQ